MHTEHEHIAQEIQALEEAQQQAARAVMPITDATLFIIVMKAMLATHRFPITNDKWEDLGRYAHMWGNGRICTKYQRNKQG